MYHVDVRVMWQYHLYLAVSLCVTRASCSWSWSCLHLSSNRSIVEPLNIKSRMAQHRTVWERVREGDSERERERVPKLWLSLWILREPYVGAWFGSCLCWWLLATLTRREQGKAHPPIRADTVKRKYIRRSQTLAELLNGLAISFCLKGEGGNAFDFNSMPVYFYFSFLENFRFFILELFNNILNLNN